MDEPDPEKHSTIFAQGEEREKIGDVLILTQNYLLFLARKASG